MKKLRKNFRLHPNGLIYYRKTIKGKHISYPTGSSNVSWVNAHATQIESKAINHYFKLVKKEKRPISLNRLKEKWLETKKHLQSYSHYKHNVEYYINNGIPFHASKSRQNAVRRNINIMIRWGIKQGYELQVIEGDTESEGRLRIITKEEFSAILNEIPNPDFKRAIQFGYYTGARRKEYNKIDKNWLNQHDGYMFVIKKGGYRRAVKINSQAQRIIDDGLWSFSKDWLSRGFKQYARQANVKNVCLHDLRTTFGFNCLQAGVSIYEVSKLLGHSSVKVTQKHYAPLDILDIKDFII